MASRKFVMGTARAGRAACLALWLSGCAGAIPPPVLSARSPADPAGEEGTPPPAAGSLLTGGQGAEAGQGAAGRKPEHGEHGPTAATAAADEYACPMHPERKQERPGTCSVCGMALEKTARGAR